MTTESIALGFEIFFSLFLPPIGFLAWRKNPSNLILRVFLAICLVAFAWIFTQDLHRLLIMTGLWITGLVFSLSDVFLLALGILLLYFGNIFPGRTRWRRSRRQNVRKKGDPRKRFRTLFWPLAGLAGLFALLSFTDLLVGGRVYYPTIGTYDGESGILYYANRLLVFLCVFLAIREQQRFLKVSERDPRRIYSRYMIMAFAFVLVAGLALFLSNIVYDLDEFLRPLLVAAITAVCAFLYSVLTFRAIALRDVLYRNALLVLTAILLLVPVFFLINYLLAFMYATSLGMLAGLLCAVFILYQFLYRRLQPYLQHLFFQKQSRADDALARYNSSVLSLSSEETLNVRKQLVDFLDDLYRPRLILFYTRKEDAAQTGATGLHQDRGLTRLVEYENIPPAELPDRLRRVLAAAGDGGLLVDFQSEAETRGEIESATWLARYASFGAEIILPIFESQIVAEKNGGGGVRSEIQAVLFIGLSEHGRPFDHSDFRLLRALRAPTLLAMKNQELLQRTTSLQQKLEEENARITSRLSQGIPGAARIGQAAAFVYRPGGPLGPILEQVERFAPQENPVLITGETGTGKEQMARLLHALSGRAGILVTVNCSAIPADLIENELFGHEKGAYTGATRSTEGMVDRARDGTLFLDEIGELPLQGQVKLLRLVQEGEYERIGSNQTLRTNARFVFATNRDLEYESARGAFRQDLFYRINTFEIRLPPLRDRKDDIPLLVSHFLTLTGDSLGRQGLKMNQAALSLLVRYSWPGNVRELENLILRAVVLGEGNEIGVDNLPIMFRDELDFDRKRLKLEKILREQARLEKELLLEALEQSKGNQRQAAELLKISRGSLQYRMKQYGLAGS